MALCTLQPFKSKSAHLFWVSFLILFLELAVIRFIPSQIRYVGFFSNIILLAALVGIGLGTIFRKKIKVPLIFIPVSIVIFQFIIRLLQYDLVVTSPEVIYFTDNTNRFQAEPIFLLPLIFFLVVFLFFLPSKLLGNLIENFRPLKAYTINIIGSLTGVFTFSLLSFLGTGPILWFPVCLLISFLISKQKNTLALLSLLIFSVVIQIPQSKTVKTVWSPYYKINLFSFPKTVSEKTLYSLTVNNISHLYMSPIEIINQENFYKYPYKLFPKRQFEDVLVIGAGAGNDVAKALDQKAKKITAVEIDPTIIDLGKQYHPERPYHSEKVKLIAGDGRYFLANSKEKFDLIVFALTDSLVLSSANANLRLESYLFTQEAFDSAKKLLKKNGLLVLYNYYRKPWLVDKLVFQIQRTFSRPPYVTLFSSTLGAEAIIIGAEPEVSFPESDYAPQNVDITPSTDDWPFLYLKEKGIPQLYRTYLGVIIVLVIGLFLLLFIKGGQIFDWAFFWLGAAFMLLETKNIVQFSLLFGSTWLTNSLVFIGLLALVLLAVQLVKKFNQKIPLRPLYGLLLSLILFGYFFPQKELLNLTPVIRLIAASFLNFSPVLVANLIFAKLFGHTKRAATAYGANLLGSFAGGICEYSSMALGYNNLTILVGIFYLLSLFFALKTSKSA